MTPVWTILNGGNPEMLGTIPGMLSLDDPRPAAEQFDERYAFAGAAALDLALVRRVAVEQFDERYAFAGGWRPMQGWTLKGSDYTLKYKGDRPLKPVAYTRFRHEIICVYPYAWVLIFNTKDQTYQVARMD